MKPEQSQECYEHHMLLKTTLDKITGFLFGNPEHGHEVSFVSKVNLMFDELSFIKKLLIGSVFTILGACVFIGQQLYKIDTDSQHLSAHLEQSKRIEMRLAYLEAKAGKNE